MTERVAPPSHCRNICTNAGSRGCVEVCAVRRSAEKFIPVEKSIHEVPPFPTEDYIYNATAPERVAINAFYVGKLVESIQGPRQEFDDEDYEPLLDDEYWHAIVNRTSKEWGENENKDQD